MLLTLSVSLTERSQTNLEKTKHNQMQNPVCVGKDIKIHMIAKSNYSDNSP